MIESAVVASAFGLLVEVLFTVALSGGPMLRGYTSLWCAPLYALAGFGLWLVGDSWAPWPVRAVVYGVVIHVFEYMTALVLEKHLGEAPWRHEFGYHLHGRIRLDYFPLWAGFGLLLEFVLL